MPNKACSGWWGVCGFDKHFSGFGFFLLSGIIPARPTTTNANRWALAQEVIKNDYRKAISTVYHRF
ncbi:MAG: hypothetical protein KJZ52_01245 [Anaerolineales bacterium]|nr:hypothetical protein [Anaerolineales bacterium]